MPAPLTIGTITWENGTSGTNGFLKWTPTGADGYNIFRAQYEPFSNYVLYAATVNGTYSDNGVNNNTQYKYYVIGTSAAGGNSAPSDIITGYVFSDRFDYAKNTLLALQAQIAANVPDMKNVFIGKREILASQLPCCVITPDKKTELYKTTTGLYDETYFYTLKIYYAQVNQRVEVPITDLMSLTGKVNNWLEVIKGNQPYWFISEISETIYSGIDTVNQLKFAEIKWSAVRRLPKMN